jgi:SAM-dependent methyltransferase
MLQFSGFDRRGYRTVDVSTGYGQWAPTYEQTVEDVMDLALLERLTEPTWHAVRRAVDLGCGTGRTGAWLRDQGVATVDGVDLTPRMLAAAHARGAHDRLVEADLTASGLDAGAYDLAIACLVDEHLPDVAPLYREAARLAAPDGSLVLVAFHPHFIMTTGMPTHFTNGAGENIAIATHVHLLSDHVTAGLAAGWSLVEMREAVVDDQWIARKPRWSQLRNHPVSVAFAWRMTGRRPAAR